MLGVKRGYCQGNHSSKERISSMPTTAVQRGVCVEAAGARLPGLLYLPPGPTGFVIFASNGKLMRIDRRQMDLSEELNARGLGTLVFDLVETSEGPEIHGNVDQLAARLLSATGWSRKQWGVAGLPIGFVGTGLGSAAALSAAAALSPKVRAVATLGGRPDLAGPALSKVQASTLLLAAVDNPVEVEAADVAAAHLSGPHRIRHLKCDDEGLGSWRMTPPTCRWMEWHLPREGG